MSALVETACISEAVKHDSFWLPGQDCDLVARRRSETLVVSFDNLGSISDRPADRPWPAWMGTRAEARGFSILGVQSHHKDWYRKPEAPARLLALKANGFFDHFETITFIGASMGGFAALSFAGLVPGARVLAFSPQSTLNRDIAPFERRYPWPYRKFDWDSPAYLDAAEHVADIASGHVFFDPRIAEDKLHAQRLNTPHLTQVPIPFAGHTLIRLLAKTGALDHLMTVYPPSGQIDAEFFRLLRNKRQERMWTKPFLAAALARNDGILSHRAATILHRDYGHRFARRMQKKRQTVAQQNT